MAMMNWHIVTTKNEFNTGSPVESDLYFIAETHEIYRGTESYAQSVVFYTDTLPNDPALNKLYINTTDLTGKVHNGTGWVDVLKPLADSIAADGTSPVTGKAVANYVAAEIAKIAGEDGKVVTNITWDDVNQILDIFKGETQQSITLNGLGVSLDYNSTSGAIQLKDASGNFIGDAINIDADRFVTGCEYDPETKTITLYFDGKTGEESTDKIEIPVDDLVDVYTAGNTQSINMSLSDSNQFTANIKISLEAGNALELKDDGLFVSVPSGGGGDVTVDNVTIQKSEEGVISVKTIQQSQVEGLSTSLEEATSNAVSQAKTYADSTFVSKTNVVAAGAVATSTELASDAKVASEKAFVEQLTWKTGM